MRSDKWTTPRNYWNLFFGLGIYPYADNESNLDSQTGESNEQSSDSGEQKW